MITLGFLNSNSAPTEEAKAALPTDLHSPSSEVIEKTVILFHDETTFQANEDQPTIWAQKKEQMSSDLSPREAGL